MELSISLKKLQFLKLGFVLGFPITTTNIFRGEGK